VSTIKVRVEYKLHLPFLEEVAPAFASKFKSSWVNTVAEETREMAAYLREVLGLEDVPAITS
jgi:hypothetical protein